MANRYVGARYVPLFTGDWDNTNTYEPLSIVLYQGDSYTSKVYVPEGIAITNTAYWVKTANFNQQLADLDNRVNSAEDDIDALETAVAGIPELFVKEDKIILGDVTINAGLTVNGSLSIAKTGYAPIAIAGWSVSGTAPISDIHINALNIGSSTCSYEVTNTGDNNKTVALVVKVLYIKTDMQ